MTRAATSENFGHRSSPQSRNLGPAILRIAGWPIESMEALRSAAFAARVDAWISDDEGIERDGEDLAQGLERLVPEIKDRRTRRMALDIKRFVHGSTRPLPEPQATDLLREPLVERALGEGLKAARARRLSHAAERDAIELAHTAEIERARTELERIAGEERFLRALCLASASTYRQWQHARRHAVDRRSRERLQSTLHRYVMRAVGRATPNGLWAGITLEDVDDAATAPLTIAPAAPVTRVTPALAVFVRGLQNMNLRRPWIEAVALRLNPTTRRTGTDAWEFGTFVDGFWCARQVAHHPAIEALTTRLALTDRPRLRDVEAMLCQSDPEITPADAGLLAEALIEAGLLWSTATLPPIHADTWQALDAIIETLPASEKADWQRCRETLARMAHEIEVEIDRIDPDALRRTLDQARETVDAVLARYEALVPTGQDVLVVDQSAPFRFSLSREFARTAEERLRLYWCFDRFGLGEIEAKAAIRHMFGVSPDDAPVPLHGFLSRGAEPDASGRARSWEERVLAQTTGDLARDAREAFGRWEREIEPASDSPVHVLNTGRMSAADAVLPPGSALLLVGAPDEGVELRIGGVTPEPCFFYARFSYLFCPDPRVPDPFLKWHKAATAEVEARWPQLQFMDLAIRNHHNPNVAARPRTASRLIDPLDHDGSALKDASIACNRDGRIVLSLAGGAPRAVPSARSAAYLGGLDRFASILASVSAFLGRPSLLAPMPRFNREIEAWRHLPRLMLAETTISPERWTPEDDFGTALARSTGAERFIRWRRFVRKARVPDLLYAFHGQNQTESLLAADSALAVEFLGRELRAHGPSLRLQELSPGPDRFAARDAEGKRYLTELALAWRGDDKFWSSYAESP
jgi:lantibiotic biosynthesis dehydratase-like protein